MTFNLRGLKKKYRLLALCFVIIFSVSFTACGKKSADMSPSPTAQSKADNGAAPNVYNNTTVEKAAAQNGDNNSKASTEYANLQTAGAQERKLTKNATLRMETKTFDKTLEIVMENVKNSGAYIENSSIGGSSYSQNAASRNAKLVIRVPKQNFDVFLSASGKAGNILDTKTVTDDITSQYFDTEAHLKSLKIQEERLLELLKKSGELKDILQLETELSNIRYKIENLTGTLQKWDNMVDYSSVTIEIYEVQELKEVKATPTSLWGKIKDGFLTSLKLVIAMLKGFLIGIISLIPFVIILVPIYFLARFVIKNFIKKK